MLSTALVIVAETTEQAEGPAYAWEVGLAVLVILFGALGIVVAIGGGREHS